MCHEVMDHQGLSRGISREGRKYGGCGSGGQEGLTQGDRDALPMANKEEEGL